MGRRLQVRSKSVELFNKGRSTFTSYLLPTTYYLLTTEKGDGALLCYFDCFWQLAAVKGKI